MGGYIQKSETVEEGLRREIKEELGVSSELTYIGTWPGRASYKIYDFCVMNFAYLTQIKGKIELDKNENSEFDWVPLRKIKDIAYDSNRAILRYVEEKFTYDLVRVEELANQLDSSAKIDEQSLYKAILNGYVSKIYEKEKLIGMGWIFPRQTLLGRQAVVEDMIVDEKYRGRGLGEKILLDLIKWAKGQGVEVVELTTNPKRIAANALYQKVGFKLHETNHYLLKLN